jgi:hypothetical protein
MKRFLLKGILFSAIYLTISVIIRFLVPYYWGNPWVGAKFKEAKAEIQKSNAIFIGSSRVYRQIIPQIFDSITGLQSYNLGAPATYTPQTYYLLENYTKSDSTNLSYCFIELMDLGDISDYLFHQERSNYYLTPKYWGISTAILLSNPYQEIKVKQLQRYTTSFIENMLHLGHFSEQLLHTDYYQKLYAGEKGFLSLDDESTHTMDTIVSKSLYSRAKALQQDSSVLAKRAQKILNIEQDSLFPNPIHLSKIKSIISNLTRKKIHPYFILLPRYTSKNARALARYVPEKYLIDLTNPEKYPEFYQVKYSFDYGHLNEQGAKYLTQKLALAFLSKQKIRWQ